MKKLGVSISIIAFSIIVVLGLYVFGAEITGHVVGIPTYSACNSTYLVSIWESVFVEGSGGASYNFTETSSTCDIYSHKTVGDITYLLKILKDPEPLLGSSKGRDMLRVIGIIGNLSDSGDAILGGSTSWNEKISALTGHDHFENRTTPLTLGDCSGEYENYFLENGTWVLDDEGDYCGFGSTNYSSVNDTGSLFIDFVGWNSLNKSYSYAEYEHIEITNETYYRALNVLGNVSDLEISAGGDYVLAFDLDDLSNNYISFDVVNETVVGNGSSNPLRYDQSHGDGVGDEVSIKSVSDFVGYVIVNISVSNYVYSDYFSFNVTVDNSSSPNLDLNSVPTLVKNFGDIDMNLGENYSLNVSGHFSDLDNDSLTYSVESALGNSVSGEIITISADNGTGAFAIKVIANDGLATKDSNNFVVTVIDPSDIVSIDGGDETTEITITDSTKSGDLKIRFGNKFDLFVEAEDINGRNLTYKWFVDGGEVVGNSNKRRFSGMGAGNYTISVEISNGVGSISKSWEITLEDKEISFIKWLIYGVFGLVIFLGIGLTAYMMVKNKEKAIDGVEEGGAVSPEIPSYPSTPPAPQTPPQPSPVVPAVAPTPTPSAVAPVVSPAPAPAVVPAPAPIAQTQTTPVAPVVPSQTPPQGTVVPGTQPETPPQTPPVEPLKPKIVSIENAPVQNNPPYNKGPFRNVKKK